MSEKWIHFPEGLEVETEDLCAIYGCDKCPGHIRKESRPVLCDHECHQIEGGSDANKLVCE